MVEGDRLFRSEANTQADEEKEYKKPCRQSDEEEFHSETRSVSIGLPGGSPGSNGLDDQQQSFSNESKGEGHYESIQ